MFGVWWVMPCHVVDLLACWTGRNRRSRSGIIWALIPHCLIWVIGRNGMLDPLNTEKSTQDLKQSFLTMLFDWVNATDIAHFNSLYELINSCQFLL